jgi:tRNA 2-selenouridine synthase
VWVEAESNKIGDLHLPVELWQSMKAASVVELHVPLADRTRHLLDEYRHFTEQPEQLKALLHRLRYRLGSGVVDEWCSDIDAGRWERFVQNVLDQHYDPAYERSARRSFPNLTETIDTTTSPDVVGHLLRIPLHSSVTC